MRNVQRAEKHPIAQLMGFMNEVAVNLIRDDARRRTRQPQWESLDGAVGDANDGDGTALVDVVTDPETDVVEEVLLSFERTALRRVVLRVLAQLPLRQQEIIRLDFANEGTLKDNEIADILDTTVGTVRNRRSLARSKLRESLQALRAKDENVDELLSNFFLRRRDA
jgi:RNA polymerase sigma factor (sigma-70 family)